MKSKLFRCFSFFVMLAVLISTMQVTLAVIAADLQSEELVFDSASNETAETAEAVDTTPYETVAYVVGEDESLRKENEKHFRMSDGSYIAAVYPEAVHYLEAGEWKDIDNTLSLTDEGYVNAENDFEVVFSSDNNSSDLYTLTNGEYSVKLILKTQNESDSAVYSLRQSNDRKIELHKIEETEKVNFDVKSTAESVETFKKNNPDATDDEIKEIVNAQNEENKRQREFMLQPKNLNSSLNYEDIVGNVDIEYIVTPSSIKENIILETANDGNVFEFILDTDLEAVLNSDGTIDLIDGENIIFSMPAPYMYDSNGETSTDVEYSLNTENGKIVLTVTADEDWVTADERIFPVTIDPTVSTHDDDDHIITEYISDVDSHNVHQGSEDWYMGCDSVNGNYYAYMKVDQPPIVPYNCKYTRVYISMFIPTTGYTSNGVSEFNVLVQEALSSWTTQFDSSATVNSNPIIDYKTLKSEMVGGRVSFDITNAATNWYNGNTSNNGVVFIPKKTDGSNMSTSNWARASFRGYVNGSQETDHMPYMCVEYMNYIGVENHFTYHTAGAGRAGNAYISDYTGHLTLSRPLISGNGFSLEYIYNSPYGDTLFTANNVYNTVDYSNMKSGNGWRLNIQQSVVEKSLKQYYPEGPVSITQLIYSDGDGTEHYFSKKEGENEYRDESGFGFTIIKSADGITHTLTDKNYNQMIFRYGYLSEIIDKNGNKVVLLYDTLDYSSSTTAWYPKSSTVGGKNQLRKIVYVTDTEGAAPITVATLIYDPTTKYLVSVLDRENSELSEELQRKIAFGYSDDMYLTSIRDFIGISDNVDKYQMTSNYYYDGDPKRMKFAYDKESQYGLAFEYHTSKKNSIMSYSDFTDTNPYDNTPWTTQNLIYASYDVQFSRFRHTGGDQAIATDDDIVTEYVFDTFGHTITTRTEDNDKNTIGVTGAVYSDNSSTSLKNNKILKNGGTGVLGQNILYCQSFEYDDSTTRWKLLNSSNNYTAERSSTEKHTGLRSYKISKTSASNTITLYQETALARVGDHTLSAYVKVTEMSEVTSNTGGFRISVKDSSGNILASSRYIKSVTPSAIDNGWIRLSCTYEATSTSVIKVCLELSGVTGCVYIDDVQFERSSSASPYNLVSNGSIFRALHYWTDRSNTAFATAEQYDKTSNFVLKITGAPEKQSYAAQEIQVNLPGTETYILSGWAKADSVPLDDPDHRSFQLTAMISYSEGEPDYCQNPFTHTAPGQWQFICVPIVPDPTRAVTTITVTCSYKGNANIAYFDDISLIRESAQSYTYDKDGNVIAVNTTNTDEIIADYEGFDLKSRTGGANGTYTYDYDDYHNVTSAVNGSVTLGMIYDSAGNVTKATHTGSDSKFMSASATYTDSGTKVESVTDNLGNITVNAYNTSKNLLTSVTVPLSDSNIANVATSATYYTYDDWNRPATTYKTGYVSLDYVYSKGTVSSITRGGYLSPGVGDKISQIYSFTYNDYGQKTKTQVGIKDGGTRTLATKDYDNSTHNLTMMTYGNGDVVSYTYDNLDRVKTIMYNDIDVYVTYTYDYMGNVAVAKVTNFAKTTEYATYSYEYDSLGRLIRFYETKNGDIVQQAQYTFDSKNRPTGVTYFDGKVTRSESVTYNDDGTISVYNLSDTSEGKVSLTYDGLQRVTDKTYDRGTSISNTFNVTKKYTYKEGEEANQTTSLVSRLMYDYRSEGTDVTLNYEYDNLGNITKVTDGSGNVLGRYMYDAQGQLVFEEVHPVGEAAYTMVYSYDTYGNIRSAKKYSGASFTSLGQIGEFGTLVSTETYSYTDTSWADLLTSYNGTTITYDAIGNPLSYFNGQSYTFTWKNGRQLASAVTGGKTVTFKYNADGIRTEKHLSSTHDIYYRLLGNKVVEMKKLSENGTERYVFIYDDSGAPYAIEYYNGYSGSMSKYYYVLNLQGDVIQIVDSENCVVANYNYDAWGKVLSVTDSNGNVITNTLNIANVNPIRYRGYFYDTETGLYYCNSRYYDPAMRRFINADAFASTGQGFLGFNMFAYSQNNPVMLVDPSGCIVTSWDRAYLSEEDVLDIAKYTIDWEYYSSQGCNTIANIFHDNCRIIREETMRKLGITNLEVASNGYVRLTSGDYSGRYVGTYVYGKNKIDYYFSDTVITLPLNQDGMYSLLYLSVKSAYELTDQMLSDYFNVWKNQFPDRSVLGLFAEIDAHYTGYFYTRLNKFKFADLEGKNFSGTKNYMPFEWAYGNW